MTRRRAGSDGRSPVDWQRLSGDYIEGFDHGNGERLWPTYEDIAAAADVSLQSVQARGRVGAWAAKREAFRIELDQERRRAILESRTQQLVDIDRRALSASEGGIALVGTRLTWLVNQTVEDRRQDREPRVDARELAALGLAAKRFMEVKAIVSGQPLAEGQETLDEAERALLVFEMEMAARVEEHRQRRDEPFVDDDADATAAR